MIRISFFRIFTALSHETSITSLQLTFSEEYSLRHSGRTEWNFYIVDNATDDFLLSVLWTYFPKLFSLKMAGQLFVPSLKDNLPNYRSLYPRILLSFCFRNLWFFCMVISACNLQPVWRICLPQAMRIYAYFCFHLNVSVLTAIIPIFTYLGGRGGGGIGEVRFRLLRHLPEEALTLKGMKVSRKF